MNNSKLYIGIFGRRNTGKSSLINLLTGQETAIVSDTPGTTTDAVNKSVEILGIGAVVLVDTAGIDDVGELGKKRVGKSMDAIKKVDCALLVIAENRFGEEETKLIEKFRRFDIPYLVVHNKSDVSEIAPETRNRLAETGDATFIEFSTLSPDGRDTLIDEIKRIIPETAHQKPSLLGNLVKPDDVVLLITPIDSEAPEGRLILPQNQTIRNALDNHCITVVVRETELESFLKLGIAPALAITDSQAFGMVSEIIPETVPLTSFSILFARLKGDFDTYLQSTTFISQLQEGDNILMLESCTHQTSCDDIGRVKIPKLLQKFTGKSLNFTFVSGLDNPPAPKSGKYALVIQCGGCMVTRKQILNRLKPFAESNIPVTNYGMALAYMNGIFERATQMF